MCDVDVRCGESVVITLGAALMAVTCIEPRGEIMAKMCKNARVQTSLHAIMVRPGIQKQETQH